MEGAQLRANLNDLFIHEFLRRYFQAHQPENCERLLDLGCGTRPYAALYTDPRRITTTADIETRVTAISVISSASALPFAAESFDTVLLSEVIEHVEDEHLVISEIMRVLKPGGTLLITWPFNYAMHEQPHDYRRPTEFGMAALLRRHGLQPFEIMRRGDIVGLLSTLLGQLVNGSAAWFRRLPFAGPIFAPIVWLLSMIVYGTDVLYFVATKRTARLHPKEVGEPTRGIAHFLITWTLGYCMAARKQRTSDA